MIRPCVGKSHAEFLLRARLLDKFRLRTVVDSESVYRCLGSFAHASIFYRMTWATMTASGRCAPSQSGAVMQSARCISRSCVSNTTYQMSKKLLQRLLRRRPARPARRRSSSRRGQQPPGHQRPQHPSAHKAQSPFREESRSCPPLLPFVLIGHAAAFTPY